jgi:U3 small nucleolar RNA-associated protein 23
MPVQRSLENTLHGKCKVFVTRCTLAEIMGEQGLHGSKRPEWLPPPMEIPLRHCRHGGLSGEGEEEVEQLSEYDCLAGLCSGQATGNEIPKNKHHFVVATADFRVTKQKRRFHVDIREVLRQTPGVPIVYVQQSVMILEELSGASKRARRGVEREKLREGVLVGRKRKRGEGEDEDKEDHDDSGVKRRGMHKAKGPNPLSIMTKKVKTDVATSSAGGNANSQSQNGDMPKAKRKRRHARRKGDGETIEPDTAALEEVEGVS